MVPAIELLLVSVNLISLWVHPGGSQLLPEDTQSEYYPDIQKGTHNQRWSNNIKPEGENRNGLLIDYEGKSIPRNDNKERLEIKLKQDNAHNGPGNIRDISLTSSRMCRNCSSTTYNRTSRDKLTKVHKKLQHKRSNMRSAKESETDRKFMVKDELKLSEKNGRGMKNESGEIMETLHHTMNYLLENYENITHGDNKQSTRYTALPRFSKKHVTRSSTIDNSNNDRLCSDSKHILKFFSIQISQHNNRVISSLQKASKLRTDIGVEFSQLNKLNEKIIEKLDSHSMALDFTNEARASIAASKKDLQSQMDMVNRDVQRVIKSLIDELVLSLVEILNEGSEWSRHLQRQLERHLHRVKMKKTIQTLREEIAEKDKRAEERDRVIRTLSMRVERAKMADRTNSENNISQLNGVSLKSLDSTIARMAYALLEVTFQWSLHKFIFDPSSTICRGPQYIKLSGNHVGKYVGVVLCSKYRYKIFLSDRIDDEFLNIGDGSGNGEDHCELISSRQALDVGTRIKRPYRFIGYGRDKWGEDMVRRMIGVGEGYRSPRWYDCRVAIP